MANKPLKTIKFPGLDDTYTVPQVDAALATSGAAADAKKVGDELSDLKQDYNQMPATKVSAHLSITRKHTGIEVRTDLENITDKYACVLAGYDDLFVDGSATKAKIVVQYARPLALSNDNNRTKFVYFTTTNKTEPFLLNAENSTRSVTNPTAGAASHTLAPNFSINQNIATPYKMFRPAIEVYDENGNVEKILYGKQVNYELTQTDPIQVNITTMSEQSDDYNFIWDGYILSYPLHVLVPDILYPSSFSENAVKYPIYNMVHSASISNDRSGLYLFIRYDDLSIVRNSCHIYPVFMCGGNIVVGNVAQVTKPDTTVKSAVSSGDTFMLDNLWYKATTDLAVGDTLVVGTNCLAIDDPVISATGSGIQSATITTVWSGTQAQYDAIVNKDANTLYFIKET